MIGHIESNITVGEIIVHGLTWILIIVCTVGIGLIFYPYSFAKFVINHASVWQDGKRYRLRCDIGVVGELKHILLWAVILILTVGIALPFYTYKVWGECLNRTTLQL